ncbi:MAG: single-stranded-DNA-specific exonuclease RecJ [Candidatus Zambryskibacteria bacterium]|nr:single-stranded-DNA-specific exonuclease RecJ [Candidatus Zambryskibacteria bacterium]
MKKYATREKPSDKIRENLKAFHPTLQELLYARGVIEHSDAELFLGPDFARDIHNPYLLKDMDKAVARILRALEAGERIGVFSDYDADGIPGAVVMSDFFEKIEYANFEIYIPHRNDEGYGMSHDATDLFKKNGVTLVITIDCGIADVGEVEYANSLGLDVIVTDHHLPHEVLPNAFAIINPKQPGCEYPEKMLCGSGVIWKVICALLQSPEFKKKYTVNEGWEKWLLDMVGLATLSDMVPLRGENRVLASYGLYVLRKSPRPGLQKLCAILKMNQAHLTEEDIGFMITPRINAASRMSVPRDAFIMLSEKDVVKAGAMAEHLNEINDERKGVVGSMVKEIKKIISEREDVLENVIVLGNPQWKPSLLGLVANSFGDEHGRPVFLWGRSGEKSHDQDAPLELKGSCRAGGDVDVMKLMEHARDAFLDFGGHRGAGGFSVSFDKVHELEGKLNKAFLELQNENIEPVATWIDKEIMIDDVEWSMYSHVEKLGPFGVDNPKPLFCIKNVVIMSLKQFGKEKNHLELVFHKSNGKQVTAIGFFSDPSKYGVTLDVGQTIDLLAHIEKSMFRNFPELRLRIVDVIECSV